MTRTDGVIHRQPMLVNGLATDMILSPQHIVDSSADFHSWTQVGFSGDSPGTLVVRDAMDNPLLELRLTRRNGLYYCNHSSLGLDDHPVHVRTFAAQPPMPDIWVVDDDDVRPTIRALRSLCDQDGDTQLCLPPLDDTNLFAPYMVPIEDLPFDYLHEGSAYFVATAVATEPTTSTKPAKKDKPPPQIPVPSTTSRSRPTIGIRDVGCSPGILR